MAKNSVDCPVYKKRNALSLLELKESTHDLIHSKESAPLRCRFKGAEC